MKQTWNAWLRFFRVGKGENMFHLVETWFIRFWLIRRKISHKLWLRNKKVREVRLNRFWRKHVRLYFKGVKQFRFRGHLTDTTGWQSLGLVQHELLQYQQVLCLGYSDSLLESEKKKERKKWSSFLFKLFHESLFAFWNRYLTLFDEKEHERSRKEY